MPKKDKAKEDAIEETPKETTVEFLASLAGVLVTGLFIITFVLQAFEIPSSSMEDTLLIGDHVFVNREQFASPTKWLGPLLPYRDIRRDEIAVFMSPEQPGLFLVKRIIGIPGDRIHLRDDVVYRNGQKLDEPFVRHKRDSHNPYTDNFPAVRPPSESYGVTNDKWAEELPSHIRERYCRCPEQLLRHGRQPRRQLRQPILGLRTPCQRHRPSHVHLLVVCHSTQPIPVAYDRRPLGIYSSHHHSFL